MKEIGWEEAALSFSDQGLIPAIVQDSTSGMVLMLAYMNRQSLQKTMETGLTWFWSRSRQRLWQKGETSGCVQRVKGIRYDCDGDALLILVEPAGPACHTGNVSCFYRALQGKVTKGGRREYGDFIPLLRKIIASRLQDRPPGSYVAKLAGRGEDGIIQKVGEEATELVIALKNRDREEIIPEAADLVFHTLLALEWSGVSWEEILNELRSRHAGREDKDRGSDEGGLRSG